MQALRFRTGKYLKQMAHCARCRADAVGKLGETNSEEINALLEAASNPGTTEQRPYVAVASMEGVFINRHLGEAPALLIYGKNAGGRPVLLGQRLMPKPGSGDDRWNEMAAILGDCAAVLVSGCGKTPQEILSRSGLSVIAVEGLIQDAVGAVLTGESVPKVLLRRAGSCGKGAGCTGTGMGCA